MSDQVDAQGAEAGGSRSVRALFRDNERFELLSGPRATGLVRALNYFGLIVPLLVVFAAIIVQLTGGELPCSHCNMERLGYFTLALGPALNLRFGIRPSHYGISLARSDVPGHRVTGHDGAGCPDVGPAGWGPVVLGFT